ncbi:hypothetical protein [Bowdeniella nasicola]|uniref:hypothetical protein n=1 Tax=Bowdeniella nasicola TaxID=208480 RepID=UPI001300CB8E|nr:hypothetical protein [Bowdeniella nasicola]
MKVLSLAYAAERAAIPGSVEELYSQAFCRPTERMPFASIALTLQSARKPLGALINRGLIDGRKRDPDVGFGLSIDKAAISGDDDNLLGHCRLKDVSPGRLALREGEP